MGIFDEVQDALGGEGDLADKAKSFINEHEAQVDQAVEKVGDEIDQHTDGKFAGTVDQAQSFLEDKTGNL